jgi:hypothetical protein
MPILSCEEQAQLAAAICATAETLGQTISATAADLMASDLADYPAPVIASALQACRRELTGKLTLAAILERVQAEDGRPGDDEAWAIALCAADESDSVVMTEEIHVALSAARPVLERGDKVGARMAFKSAYVRAVDTARRQAKPVKWSLSMGTDPQRRLLAVEEAARQGRLPAPEAAAFVAELALAHAPITGDGLAIAGLLTGNVVAMPSPHLRQKWQELGELVKRNKVEAEARREAQRQAEQAALASRKSEAEKALAKLKKEPAHV